MQAIEPVRAALREGWTAEVGTTTGSKTKGGWISIRDTNETCRATFFKRAPIDGFIQELQERARAACTKAR